MDPCDLRGPQDRVRRRALIETADVFRDRPIEQRHILGQIADVAPQILVAPLVDRRSVKAHDPLLDRPDPHQRF